MEPLKAASAPPLRVLVVDADRRVRQSLCGLIDLADGMAVACSAADPAGALANLAAERVDVVLLDPRLPDLESGAALVGAIRRDWPVLPIVALCWSDETPRSVSLPVTVAPCPVQPDSLVELLRAAAAGTAPVSTAGLS